jgi:transposase
MATMPLKVREAIVRLHEAGQTYLEIAATLSVGVATVNRTLRRKRETGSVAPRPRGGGNFSPIQGETASLLERLVDEMPDGTAEELASELGRRGEISTSRSGVQRALHRLGFSKKNGGSWHLNATTMRTAYTARSSAKRSNG